MATPYGSEASLGEWMDAFKKGIGSVGDGTADYTESVCTSFSLSPCQFEAVPSGLLIAAAGRMTWEE